VSIVVVAELTVLVHYVGDRFSKSEDTADVTRITGLPVLAKIPKGSGLELVEAFRVLRTNLMVLEGAGKPRTLAVVSANQAAGKTFTAVHLAQSAAGLDEKVVIVDADLRRPSVHERLGVPRAPGLSAVLQGNDLATMLRKLPDTPFLRVLTSGAPVQDASAVLGARPFRHVLDSLRAVRLVVVDTPPAAMFADAMAVASQCDATIFVLDVKTSRRRQVRQTLEALERAGANLVGVVVNRTASPRRASYYYEA
jgi:capsular exopolysaccharide synthesis family protein